MWYPTPFALRFPAGHRLAYGNKMHVLKTKSEFGIYTKGKISNKAYILGKVRKPWSSDKRQCFLHVLWTVLHFIGFKLLSGMRWCFARLYVAEPWHCWSIPMECSSCKVKRQPKTLHSLYSAPQGHNPLKSNLLLLLSPLFLPDQIRFLPAMLLLLAYTLWFFCSCATIKWSIYRESHLSHSGSSHLFFYWDFFIYITYNKNYKKLPILS